MSQTVIYHYCYYVRIQNTVLSFIERYKKKPIKLTFYEPIKKKTINYESYAKPGEQITGITFYVMCNKRREE